MGLGIAISLVTFGVTYVRLFAQDFKKENLEKSTPFLIIAAVVIVILGLIMSL